MRKFAVALLVLETTVMIILFMLLLLPKQAVDVLTGDYQIKIERVEK